VGTSWLVDREGRQLSDGPLPCRLNIGPAFRGANVTQAARILARRAARAIPQMSVAIRRWTNIQCLPSDYRLSSVQAMTKVNGKIIIPSAAAGSTGTSCVRTPV